MERFSRSLINHVKMGENSMEENKENGGFFHYLRLYVLNDWVIGVLIFLGISFVLYFLFYHLAPLLRN